MIISRRDKYAKSYGFRKSRKQKTQGVIYIEDITDKEFWEKIATQHVVKLYSENGTAITGKSKLLEICSKNQLIAIDSDFDWICPNHREESQRFTDKKEFILQTYAHGRENLVLSPEYLCDVLNHYFRLYVDNHENHIMEIVQKLSEIWFEPYRKFLFLLNQKTVNFSHKDWISRIKFQGSECKDIALKLDFSNYQTRLENLDNEFNQKINNQQDYQIFCEYLAASYFIESNVYAFIRCHDWENQFVLPIMKAICTARRDTEKAYIEQFFQNQETEIKHRKKQVINHFEENMYMPTVLNLQFYSSYFEKARTNNFFIQQIIKDYNRILV